MRLAMSVGTFERRNIVADADFVQHAERCRVDGVWSAKRSKLHARGKFVYANPERP